jgi:hypothetical protein
MTCAEYAHLLVKHLGLSSDVARVICALRRAVRYVLHMAATGELLSSVTTQLEGLTAVEHSAESRWAAATNVTE